MAAESEEKKPTPVGITMVESEVFETDDLPEEDQQQHREMSMSTQEVEGLEQVRLDVKEAFKLFEDKNIECTFTDFSDSIATKKSGYLSSQRKATESLEQKHARLSEQLRQLKEEILLVKDKDTDTEGDLMAKVEYMARELSGGRVLKGGGVADALKLENNRGNVEARRLMNDLDAFLTTTTTTTSTNPSQASSAAIQYDITISDQHNADSLLLESLEQRVSRCEKVVGKLNTQALNSPDNPSKTVMGALSLVVARFSLLDLSQLQHFESCLLAIHQRIIQASGKSDASDIADKVDKLEGMYETVKKWDSLANALPYMLDRLLVMKSWHLQAIKDVRGGQEGRRCLREASQFSKALRLIRQRQQELSEALQSQTDNLKQIQALLAPQLTLFEENCQQVESLIN